MARRKFTPRTLRFDERMLTRGQESFNGGQVSDVEPIDIKLNSAAKLVNARGHNNAVKGATGSRLWQTGLELPAEQENLSMTLTGTTMTCVGCFQQTSVGYIIYATNSTTLEQEIFFITEYLSNDTVTVDGETVGANESYINCDVVGKINARIFDDLTNIEYMLIGTKIWYRDINSTTWTEYFVIDSEKVVNAESQFYKIKNKIALNNLGGDFALSDVYEDEKYTYTANGDLPDYPLDGQPDTTAPNPSSYRYLYGYVRQKGDYTLNRNSEDTFTEVETPPHLRVDELIAVPDDNFTPFNADKDYTQIKTERPVDDSYYRRYLIIDENYKSYEAWKALSEDNKSPFMYITYNGVNQKMYLNFSFVENMNDVARAFRTSLLQIDGNFECRYNYDDTNVWFEFYNTDATVDWSQGTFDTFNGKFFKISEDFPVVISDLGLYIQPTAAIDDKYVGLTVKDSSGILYAISGTTQYKGVDVYTVSSVTGTPSATFNQYASAYAKGGAVGNYSPSNYTPNSGSPSFGTTITNTGSTLDLDLDDIETLTGNTGFADEMLFYDSFEETGTAISGERTYKITNGTTDYVKLTIDSTGDGFELKVGSQTYTDSTVVGDAKSASYRIFSRVNASGVSTCKAYVLIVNTDNVRFEFEKELSASTTVTGTLDVNYKLIGDAVISKTSIALIKAEDVVSSPVIRLSSQVSSYNTTVNSDAFTQPAGSLAITDNNDYVYIVSGETCYSNDYVFYSETTYTALDLENAGFIQYESQTNLMGVEVFSFRYPKNRKDITHYSLYRTKDIFPHTLERPDLTDERITNNPETYAWIEDVPVVGAFKGTIYLSPNTLVVAGTPDYGILGETIRRDGAVAEYVLSNPSYDDINDETTYDFTFIGASGSDGIEYTFYYGTETVTTATQDALGVITSAYVFSDSDVGKTIFWEDGSTSIIGSVASGVATTIDTTPKSVSQLLMLDPTERLYYDTTSDITQNGNLAVWPLNLRNYDKTPNSNISTYHNSVLMKAVRDVNKIFYSSTTDYRSFGYHHPVFQVNDSLEEGIRCMLTVNDLMCVLTTSSTHHVNPKDSQVITNEFGEYYLLLRDPFLVHNAIGATHQFKWKYGEKGDVCIITNEPAIRFFNGNTYGRNLADGKIQHTILQKMNDIIFLSYSSVGGIHIWGEF